MMYMFLNYEKKMIFYFVFFLNLEVISLYLLRVEIWKSIRNVVYEVKCFVLKVRMNC